MQWGESWKDTIDNALASVAFFIPVLTPRYFRSAECRRELQFFARKATDLGIRDLVLPLLYVDVAALHQTNTTDELIPLIRGFQWEDWRELRFADPTSESYRRGVARLTQRLAAANQAAESVPISVGLAEIEVEHDEPGLIDLLADSEAALPRWTETVHEITKEIDAVGGIMEDATTETATLDKAGKGFAGRTYIAKKTARRLAEPADRLVHLGSAFATQMYEVDAGFQALIRSLSEAAPDDNNEVRAVCEFFAAIRGLAISSEAGLAQVEEMVRQASSMEAMSRDLRAPLRRMREGLTMMLEARAVAREWVQLIDASGIDCSQFSSAPVEE